ncbi:hypothetical protein ACTI_47580 [Actinoplanes sp. OR16]|uniref:DUF4132 domain-containing protein n=1 Tax=Actinoplanes sp. OR16 TaxID=946334 RepID=UPI000F6ED760|nr:DUF4132 domain-containing protein [Actinoplanes sp. OR16]BBH68073.1 hypothetical protein ACTI_47580 [Actinoplanes sp. OR16]
MLSADEFLAGRRGGLDADADASVLTGEDLGTLLPVAYSSRARLASPRLSRGVLNACQTRQPSFTPAAFTALLRTLVAEGGHGDPVLAACALLRLSGPPPAEASRLAGKLVTSSSPFAGRALAALSGARPRRGSDEVKVLTAAGPAALALVSEIAEARAVYYSPPQLPDVWERLAAVPGYAEFTRRALAQARDHVGDIHARRVVFKADAAFDADRVQTLGRAVRVALLRDEPWLLDVLRPLVLGVAVAPTAAKTLPSQALLYEVARAAEEMPTPELLALVREARETARHKGVHQQLDRKIQRIVRSLGDRPDVALRLPDLGFDGEGVLMVPVGAHEAVVTVGESVSLGWRQAGAGSPGGVRAGGARADGARVSGAVPAVVRRERPEAVKELRDLVKQVRGHLATVARSLEAGFATGHELSYQEWCSQLMANALGRQVVGRLIWEFRHPDGGWHAVLPVGSSFVGADGGAVAEPPAEGRIRLWHPLRATGDEVQAWRDLLSGRQVRQPIKQAYREVYRLTPAEEETGDYSNRFAAHIVHYKQLYALFKGFGWTTSMLGPWDGGGQADATRVVAGGKWRIGLSHDYRDETAGGVVWAGTDRVWFERRAGGSWRSVPLAEVPPLVFSEAMRDVDLFVSVTSVAADPTWFDGHLDYWRRENDAALTATAEVRRSALARILPRTKIGSRCELTDRHLVVRGELHTYRIHLGSGNILMEPGNTYLCIVPARKGPQEEIFIPFAEDRLAVILSKAFLLADDTAITDPSIVSQLRRSNPADAGAPA